MENLNKKELNLLYEAIYIYDWITNSHKTNTIEEINKFCQKIFKYLYENGLSNNFDVEDNNYFPTAEFEEKMHNKYLDEYNDETFWNELEQALGIRDFYRKYGKKAIEKMNREEKFLKQEEEINKYIEEFDENGIERLEINK